MSASSTIYVLDCGDDFRHSVHAAYATEEEAEAASIEHARRLDPKAVIGCCDVVPITLYADRPEEPDGAAI